MLTKNCGFTVIELILVISIMAILISVSYSGFYGWLEYYKLHSDIKELYFSFIKIRQLTIMKQEVHGIRFEEEKRKYIIFSETRGDIDTNLLRQGVSYSEGDIRFGGDNKMTFKPIGTAEGGHVTLTDRRGNEFVIYVYGHTGRVRYERKD